MFAEVDVVKEVTAGSEKDDTCGTKVIEVRPPVKVATPESANILEVVAIRGGFDMLDILEDTTSDEETKVLLVLTRLGGLDSKLSLSDSLAGLIELLQVERWTLVQVVWIILWQDGQGTGLELGEKSLLQ